MLAILEPVTGAGTMSDSSPPWAIREQLRRQFIEQAAAGFDRVLAIADAHQREERARELGQQLVSAMLQHGPRSETGFLQDIFAHPEEDGPRLIYADWLDDNHQPARAELIRVQCRLAREGPGCLERDLLELREQELLKEHGATWMAHLPGWARKVARIERGFVNHLALRASDYLRRGTVLRQQVYFDSLRLTRLEGQAEALLGSGLLAGVRHLALEGTGSAVAAVLGSPQLAGLVSLELCCPVSAEICRALAASAYLGRLRRLAFRYAELGPAQAAILSQAPMLSQLQELAVEENNELGAEGARALGRSPHWRQLRQLSFHRSRLGPAAVRELVRAPIVQTVTSLDLSLSDTREAAKDLARAPLLEELAHLNLHGAEIDDAGLKALGKASHLPRLASLSLFNNLFTADALAAFTRGPLLARLRRLVLGSGMMGRAGVRGLVESPACSQLRSLTLEYCNLGPEDAAALAGSPHLSGLISLDLAANRIGATGATALAAANFPALRYLDVSSNGIGNEGASALASSSLGKQLGALKLHGNDIRMVLRPQLQAELGGRACF
jgi:uncharacterized protein (TIGR02996 family)